jgi:mannose/cellobiose epimerase-like protein (N-acyl-D-glucosamine 2-epimerase family)
MSTPEALSRFVFDTLFSLCRDRFADPLHGGFHERLDCQLRPLPLGYKRLMVQCRQIYVLCETALNGNRSGATVVEAACAFLQRSFRDERHGGWFYKARSDGAPLDRAKDLYGHAFVLFAQAYLHRAFAAPEAVAIAATTMDVIKARLAAPNGGFWDGASETWEPQTAVRRQNPHMHLLEAVLALFEATRDSRWMSEANALVELFYDRFYDAKIGVLGEYFDRDWRPDPERGHIVEPGHLFEWSWLLSRYRSLSGNESVMPTARRLFDRAVSYGFDSEHGGIHDQIDRSLEPLLRSRRIWPVAEAIKACLAQLEAGHVEAAGRARELIDHLLSNFLLLKEGRWIETLSRDGKATQTDLPGSTPYHLFLATAEVVRVLLRPNQHL